jgi:mannose-6-phosphate isomerase-like protein (cupin superfamily)
MLREPKVVVTGHTEDGTATIISDQPPRTYPNPKFLTTFYEVWNEKRVPVTVSREMHDSETDLTHPPPRGGVRIRMHDFEPAGDKISKFTYEEIVEHFREVGSDDAVPTKENWKQAFMHRTESIDFGIMIEGQLTMIMEDCERTLYPGDVVVQVGTNHGWENRGDTMSRIAFVLLDGDYDDELRGLLGTKPKPPVA